jgi:DNA-binding transcriptional MocR family regulator
MLELRAAGMGLRDIAREVGIAHTTVQRSLARMAAEGVAVPQPQANEGGAVANQTRYLKAKADEQETKAHIAKLNLERMQGDVLGRKDVLVFLQNLRGRLNSASAALKRVYPPGVEVLAEEIRGLNGDVDRLLGDRGEH